MLQSLNLSLSIWVALIATPIAIAVGQVLFKMASSNLGAVSLNSFLRLLIDPIFIVAIVLYGSATVIWVFVLKSVPLSLAYMFMALTYCIVPVLAYYFFDEAIGWQYFVGTLFILAGLAIIVL
ncbi:transporter [Parasulfitobacter algicola]|uniref:Transporter n=1 Tax=Parasulfitobacter algicola TaxID=2614809 RepID=A0ABX2J162_9RHOB|nr:transporter [Sulfitobacter algicola]NSX56573.1 transporter [Sulfitobacter algicola]